MNSLLADDFPATISPFSLRTQSMSDTHLLNSDCRGGYTVQHAGFGLLHVAVAAWFISASQRAPTPLRVLLCASSAVAVLYHGLLGSMCSSPWVSAAVQALEIPHVGFVWVNAALGGLFAVVPTSYFIVCNPRSGELESLAKLLIVNSLALANAVCLCIWLHDCSLEKTQALTCNTVVLALACFGVIYLETKSRAVALYPAVMLAVHIPVVLLSMAFPIDMESRRIPPEPDDSDMQPHWSIVLRWFLLEIRPLAVRYTVGHAVISHTTVASQKSQLPTGVMPFATNLASLQLGGAKWILLSGLVAFIAMFSIQVWPSSKMLTQNKRDSIPGGTRELLGLHTNEGIGIWGMVHGVQGGALIALLVLMVLFRAKRHLPGNAGAQKRARSDAPEATLPESHAKLQNDHSAGVAPSQSLRHELELAQNECVDIGEAEGKASIMQLTVSAVENQAQMGSSAGQAVAEKTFCDPMPLPKHAANKNEPQVTAGVDHLLAVESLSQQSKPTQPPGAQRNTASEIRAFVRFALLKFLFCPPCIERAGA